VVVAGIAVLCAAVVLVIFENNRITPGSHASSTAHSASGSSEIQQSSAAVSSAASSAVDNGLLILVNKDNPVPADYNPAFVSIPMKYFISDAKTDQDHFVAAAAPYLEKMIDDAASDGVSLDIVSGYRSKTYQQGLFQSDVSSYLKLGYSESKAESATAQKVAVPGYSEHQTGLACDLGYNGKSNLTSSYDKTPAFAWLMSHCADYGFILRYPEDKVAITGYEYEPWHYRFVGVDDAKKIMQSGLCLEEYLKELK
jgi:D-alanyl-D-alanine carboxypeptidase